MTTKTLLAVDGNSLLHRSFHALQSTGLHSRDGRPTWAVKGFCSQLLNAVERTGASAIVVGFDDHTFSVRKDAHPYYKAQRKPKPPELGQQIATTIEVLRAAGVHVVVPAGLEADDVMASAAAYATSVGWHTVIVTSDRDSFALINDTTSVLRVMNRTVDHSTPVPTVSGGMEASPILTPKGLRDGYGIDPSSYREYAAMRGDTSDNLPGILGIGEKTAAKLINAFSGSVQAAFDDADGDGALVTQHLGRAAVGKLRNPESRAAFWRNVEIMTMHRDIPLGLDLINAGAGLLPLSSDSLLAALDSVQLTSLRQPAVRTLCGSMGRGEPEVPQPPDGFYDAPPVDFDDPAEFTRPPAPVARSLTTTGAMRGSTAPRPSTWDDTLW